MFSFFFHSNVMTAQSMTWENNHKLHVSTLSANNIPFEQYISSIKKCYCNFLTCVIWMWNSLWFHAKNQRLTFFWFFFLFLAPNISPKIYFLFNPDVLKKRSEEKKNETLQHCHQPILLCNWTRICKFLVFYAHFVANQSFSGKKKRKNLKLLQKMLLTKRNDEFQINLPRDISYKWKSNGICTLQMSCILYIWVVVICLLFVFLFSSFGMCLSTNGLLKEKLNDIDWKRPRFPNVRSKQWLWKWISRHETKEFGFLPKYVV